MEKIKYSSDTIENAIIEAQKDLNRDEEELIINEIKDEEKPTIEVIVIDDYVQEIKDFIKELIENMGIQSNIEIIYNNAVPTYTIYSDNDSLLIGRNGKNIDSLTTIVKQHIIIELGKDDLFKFNIDINDYKLANDARLDHLAKKIAKDVARTKIAVKMDPMNSYKRRIVHAAIASNKRVTSKSEGEEPNRCVVIRPVPYKTQEEEEEEQR